MSDNPATSDLATLPWRGVPHGDQPLSRDDFIAVMGPAMLALMKATMMTAGSPDEFDTNKKDLIVLLETVASELERQQLMSGFDVG